MANPLPSFLPRVDQLRSRLHWISPTLYWIWGKKPVYRSPIVTDLRRRSGGIRITPARGNLGFRERALRVLLLQIALTSFQIKYRRIKGFLLLRRRKNRFRAAKLSLPWWSHLRRGSYLVGLLGPCGSSLLCWTSCTWVFEMSEFIYVFVLSCSFFFRCLGLF